MMTKEELQQKLQETADQFNKLRNEADTIEDELKRLQGDYRTYEALLNQPDPASTVDAEPTLKAEDVKAKAK